MSRDPAQYRQHFGSLTNRCDVYERASSSGTLIRAPEPALVCRQANVRMSGLQRRDRLQWVDKSRHPAFAVRPQSAGSPTFNPRCRWVVSGAGQPLGSSLRGSATWGLDGRFAIHRIRSKAPAVLAREWKAASLSSSLIFLQGLVVGDLNACV
jgi:hypothetical protein